MKLTATGPRKWTAWWLALEMCQESIEGKQSRAQVGHLKSNELATIMVAEVLRNY